MRSCFRSASAHHNIGKPYLTSTIEPAVDAGVGPWNFDGSYVRDARGMLACWPGHEDRYLVGRRVPMVRDRQGTPGRGARGVRTRRRRGDVMAQLRTRSRCPEGAGGRLQHEIGPQVRHHRRRWASDGAADDRDRGRSGSCGPTCPRVSPSATPPRWQDSRSTPGSTRARYAAPWTRTSTPTRCASTRRRHCGSASPLYRRSSSIGDWSSQARDPLRSFSGCCAMLG